METNTNSAVLSMSYPIEKKNVSLPQQTNNKRGLIILSTARTTSTLFMRLLSQPLERSDIKGKVLLEPSTVVFHLDNHPNAPDFYPHPHLPQTRSNYEKLIYETILDCRKREERNGKGVGEGDENALNGKGGKKFVIKDLAYQCNDYLSDELIKIMGMTAQIVFLIRNPADTIPSGMYPYLTAEDKLQGYQSHEADFVELKALFKRFEMLTGVQPWVVEAEEYLHDPQKEVEKLCKEWHWPWKESYLELVDKESVCGKGGMYEKECSVWGELWYGQAFKSKKVAKSSKYKKQDRRNGKYKRVWKHAELQLKELFNKHVPAYLWLKKNGRRVKGDVEKSESKGE